jgi:hypothetical protein
MSDRSPKREHDEPAAKEPDETSPPSPDLGDGGEDLDAEAKAVLEEEGARGLDEIDVRDLLRSALAPPKGAVAPELLRGVQRKIRTRSRGKFYGDGWSTARSPRSTYLVTSLLMLILIALVYFILVPWGGGALH